MFMTVGVDDGATPPVAHGESCVDVWEGFWVEFDARHAKETDGTRRVLASDELDARPGSHMGASFGAQSCAERIARVFRADHAVVVYPGQALEFRSRDVRDGRYEVERKRRVRCEVGDRNSSDRITASVVREVPVDGERAPVDVALRPFIVAVANAIIKDIFRERRDGTARSHLRKA
ncbi:MAG: hypothetical protein ACRENE_19655 [Polyangiaceae bacterium]